jgi:hypothetical protein
VRHSLTTFWALLLAACAPMAAAQAQDIDWSIRRGGSEADASKVQLTVETRWGANNRSLWSSDTPITELRGLTSAQVIGPRQPVRFAIVRDAGRLDCSGVAGNRTGVGECVLSPDAAFASYLQGRGIGRPDSQQTFSLVMSRVGRDLVESMQAIGYARPTIDQLVSMGVHGVSAQFVRGLAQSGYRLGSAQDLVNFKIHGVDIDYIRAMAAISPQLSRLPADKLVSMRIHGAKPEMVRAFVAMGKESPSADGIVAMAIHGVTAAYIGDLAALGYRDLSADELVSMRIHGVSADYVRSLHRNGMTRLSAEQLVRLRISGFRPDRR